LVVAVALVVQLRHAYEHPAGPPNTDAAGMYIMSLAGCVLMAATGCVVLLLVAVFARPGRKIG
jgi:hypothetical protein